MRIIIAVSIFSLILLAIAWYFSTKLASQTINPSALNQIEQEKQYE